MSVKYRDFKEQLNKLENKNVARGCAGFDFPCKTISQVTLTDDCKINIALTHGDIDSEDNPNVTGVSINIVADNVESIPYVLEIIKKLNQ